MSPVKAKFKLDIHSQRHFLLPDSISTPLIQPGRPERNGRSYVQLPYGVRAHF